MGTVTATSAALDLIDEIVADHAAAFYAGSGGDPARALQLAQANAANRPTRRAVEMVRKIAGA